MRLPGDKGYISTKRYYVVGTTGYTISNAEAPPKRRQTSWSILDRYYNHKEVRRYYVPRRGGGRGPRSDTARLLLAQLECARLNADERAWERQEGTYAP